MKRYIMIAWCLVAAATAPAQTAIETTVSADFVNEYVWRGQELGGTSVQPTLGVACKGLSLAAWGSYGLTNPADTKELDLTLAYSVKGLHVGVTDYWTDAPGQRYFVYTGGTASHVFEASLGYDFGVASLQWFTNFAGNDGVNRSGKRAYSSYAEVSVPFALGGIGWSATAGCVPFASSYYGTTGFAVTNLTLRASKVLKAGNSFALPVFAQFTGNPSSQKAFLVFGFTLQP